MDRRAGLRSDDRIRVEIVELGNEHASFRVRHRSAMRVVRASGTSSLVVLVRRAISGRAESSCGCASSSKPDGAGSEIATLLTIEACLLMRIPREARGWRRALSRRLAFLDHEVRTLLPVPSSSAQAKQQEKKESEEEQPADHAADNDSRDLTSRKAARCAVGGDTIWSVAASGSG